MVSERDWVSAYERIARSNGNPYTCLDVPPSCKPEERLTGADKRLALIFHPDRVPNTTRTFRDAATRREELAGQADRAFRIIASALDLIVDARKRKQYDAGQRGGSRGNTAWTPMETDDAYGFADENSFSKFSKAAFQGEGLEALAAGGHSTTAQAGGDPVSNVRSRHRKVDRFGQSSVTRSGTRQVVNENGQLAETGYKITGVEGREKSGLPPLRDPRIVDGRAAIEKARAELAAHAASRSKPPSSRSGRV